MSTIWEMAATIRAERNASGAVQVTPEVRRQEAHIDVAAPARLDYWCRLLGTTPLQLCYAVDAVGADPTAVRRFLTRRRA